MAGIAFHPRTAMTDLVNVKLQMFCQVCGVSVPYNMDRILAGRNSDVHKISNSHGQWILKTYYQHSSDKRDRLGNEFGFLTYLNKMGTTVVARPLCKNPALQCALYTYLSGVRPASVISSHISQAAHFIKAINLSRKAPDALALAMAADACLSWQAHMELVASRIDRLLAVHPKGELLIDAHKFVREQLLPMWLRLQAKLMKLLAPSQIALPLPMDDWIISPSDFGFHNVLENQGELFFLDFEYAGWDDPAKLICDFICQPELPVTQSQGQQFMDELLSDLPYPDRLKHRVESLMPVHRLKWCCILLNEFRVEDLNRRLHAGAELEGLLADQLSKAKRYFNTHLAAQH